MLLNMCQIEIESKYLRTFLYTYRINIYFIVILYPLNIAEFFLYVWQIFFFLPALQAQYF